MLARGKQPSTTVSTRRGLSDALLKWLVIVYMSKHKSTLGFAIDATTADQRHADTG